MVKNIERTTAQQYRFDSIVQASEALGKANQLEAFAENQHNPEVIGRTIKEKVPKEALMAKASYERKKAAAFLNNACGACALRDTCKIANSLPRWGASHPFARNPKDREIEVEDRAHMISRIKRNPDAPCDPTKVPHIQDSLFPDDLAA